MPTPYRNLPNPVEPAGFHLATHAYRALWRPGAEDV